MSLARPRPRPLPAARPGLPLARRPGVHSARVRGHAAARHGRALQAAQTHRARHDAETRCEWQGRVWQGMAGQSRNSHSNTTSSPLAPSFDLMLPTSLTTVCERNVVLYNCVCHCVTVLCVCVCRLCRSSWSTCRARSPPLCSCTP